MTEALSILQIRQAGTHADMASSGRYLLPTGCATPGRPVPLPHLPCNQLLNRAVIPIVCWPEWCAMLMLVEFKELRQW